MRAPLPSVRAPALRLRPGPAALGLPAPRAAPMRTSTCHPRPPRARPNLPSALCERLSLRARHPSPHPLRPPPTSPLTAPGGWGTTESGPPRGKTDRRQWDGEWRRTGRCGPGGAGRTRRLRGHSLSCFLLETRQGAASVRRGGGSASAMSRRR